MTIATYTFVVEAGEASGQQRVLYSGTRDYDGRASDLARRVLREYAGTDAGPAIAGEPVRVLVWHGAHQRPVAAAAAMMTSAEAAERDMLDAAAFLTPGFADALAKQLHREAEAALTRNGIPVGDYVLLLLHSGHLHLVFDGATGFDKELHAARGVLQILQTAGILAKEPDNGISGNTAALLASGKPVELHRATPTQLMSSPVN